MHDAAELLAELEDLRTMVAELRHDLNQLKTPTHGEKTIFGRNVQVDPTAVFISRENARIRIGDHSIVWRGGEWLGPVTVGARVFINQGSYIRPNVTIEDEVSLQFHSTAGGPPFPIYSDRVVTAPRPPYPVRTASRQSLPNKSRV